MSFKNHEMGSEIDYYAAIIKNNRTNPDLTFSKMFGDDSICYIPPPAPHIDDRTPEEIAVMLVELDQILKEWEVEKAEDEGKEKIKPKKKKIFKRLRWGHPF